MSCADVQANNGDPRTSSRVLSIGDRQFASEVMRDELPVLVEFWAPWCAPCRLFRPVLEELAEAYAGRIRVVAVDTDEHAGQARIHGVLDLPTLILFADGVERDRILGALPAPLLKLWIERLL